MTMTHREALALVTGPGGRYELRPVDLGGHGAGHVFAHAPSTLRDVYDQARSHGDSTFLVYGDERITFAETFAAADAFAATLVDRYAVGRGDRVAIAMRNYPEWIMAFLGITSTGAVCVPLNSWWTSEELAYAVGDSAPTVVVADEPRAALLDATCRERSVAVVVVRPDDTVPDHATWADVVHPAQPPDLPIGPEDDATILYTSGTTGFPKGAVSTHRAVVHALWGTSAQEAVEAVKLGSSFPRSDAPPAMLLAVPLFHVTGCVAVMLNALRGGQKLVMMHRWDAEEALRLIEAERLTAFIGVPTQCFDIVNHPRVGDVDLSSLQWVGGGGSATPPALLSQLRQQVPQSSPSFGWGMTETNALGPAICCDEAFAHPESVGWLPPSMELEIRDPTTSSPLPAGESGEIWVRGPSLIRGYWNRPEATAEALRDGWLRTGDVGHLDHDGRAYIDDRITDMIVRGGENVYCAEVEAVLYEHPDVLEAAVFGLPDERLGEEVAATVVRRPHSSLDREALVEFLAARLAAFKVPSALEIGDTVLPRTPSGKFVKTALRDQRLRETAGR